MALLPGLESADLPADAIEVGRIADAWGIKGWFKVLPYSANSEALFYCKNWFLLPAEKGTKTFSGVGELVVTEAKDHSGTVVASAHGVTDRNAADLLRGARIFIPRSSFPTANDNEYYWVDLIGLEVINRESVSLGRVCELLSTGPQTVLVIEYTDADQIKQRMIPFVAAYVDDVRMPLKQILVDWQPDF